MQGRVHGLEHPDDPEETPLPSVFGIPKLRGMELRTDSSQRRIHQCALGGCCLKPTCISGTFDDLEGEGPFSLGNNIHEQS